MVLRLKEEKGLLVADKEPKSFINHTRGNLRERINSGSIASTVRSFHWAVTIPRNFRSIQSKYPVVLFEISGLVRCNPWS